MLIIQFVTCRLSLQISVKIRIMEILTLLAPFFASVPGFLAGYFGEKLMDKYMLDQRSFIDTLQDTVQQTVLEYSDADNRNYGRLTAFYHSPKILEELLKYRMMASTDYDPAKLLEALEAETDLYMPTSQELSRFLELFMSKVQDDDELKKLEIRENFQAEVFHISRAVAELSAKIDTMSQIYNGELEIQWKDRIDTYVKTIGNFKPATALGLIEALENSISIGSRSPGERFLAGLEFQKGQCYGFLGKGEESYRSKIKAYRMLPTNVVFAKNAAICYYRMKDYQTSRSIAFELLQKDPFCPVGWAYKLLTSDEPFDTAISEIPHLVRIDPGFLRHVNLEIKEELKPKLREYDLVPDPITYIEKPVTTENYADVVFWMNLATTAALHNYYVDFFSMRTDDRPIINKLGRMLESFLSKLDGSEVPQDYPKLKFLYAFTNFSQNPDAENALAMENALGQLKKMEWLFVVQAANGLQLTGHADRAALILEKQPDLATEGLLLLVYCYAKVKDDAAYIATVKRFAASISDFPEQLALMYINLVLELKLNRLIDGFTKEDFLKNKVFLSLQTEEIVNRFVTMIFEGVNESTTQYFHQLVETNIDEMLIGVIGSGFFAVDAYEEALPILARSIDPNNDSRELYQYIIAQQKTGKNLNELLRLLKNWRENFPFVGEFLRAEAYLRRDLVDWEEVCTICEMYLNKITEDSGMLAIYLNALHHLNTAESVKKIITIADNLANYSISVAQNASIICDLLIIHGHYEKAFDLIYPFASDPKQIQVRGNYNNFVLRLPQDISGTPLKEYSIIEEGHFVKYEHNGIVGYVEINSETIIHPVYGQFIGKKIGDEIRTKRKMVNVEDVFVIKRVMNKYLSVYDEILNQSEVDPYAGLPFQSMKFDPNHPGGILKAFEELLGGGKKIRLEDRDADFKAYYANELSMTELVFREYKDDFIECYYNLIQFHKGINAAPRVYFERRELDLGENLVIDMSSLLLLHQMSKFHQYSFSGKFIISRYIVDQLKSRLTALELRIDPFDTPVHEWGRTAIDDDSLEFRNDRKSLLNGLLEWIEANCIISLSERTIEMIRGANINVGENGVIDAAVSTALLVQDVQGRVLITEDLFYIKTNILNGIEITSTEDFIKRLDNHESLLNEFVRNRIINFAPSVVQLVQEFAKTLSGQYSRYDLLLENASLVLCVDNLRTVLDFVKELLLNPVLTNDQLTKHITHVFSVVMKSTPGKLFFGIRQSLLLETYLLGNRRDLALSAFDDARGIIEQSWLEE